MLHPLRVVLLGLCIASLAPAADAPAPTLPANNPYAAAFAALARLTPADKEALTTGKPASPAAAPIVSEINRALAAGRREPSVDWGIDYEHGDYSAKIPGISESIVITKITLGEADQLPAPLLADRSIEMLALARHIGRDGPLINLMLQRKIEEKVYNALEKNLSKFSSQEARSLIAGINSLPTGGDLATALAVEKMFWVDRIADAVRKEIIENLGEANEHSGSFASRLRLAGILTDGAITSVGLEQEAGAFWLKPGEKKHGITLLSVKRARDEALLVCNGQIARIKLSSRKITGVYFSRFADVTKSLPADSWLRGMLIEMGETTVEAAIRNIEMAPREIEELYNEVIAHPENFTDEAAYKKRIQKLSFFAKTIVPSLPRIIQLDQKASDLQAKMRAALTAIATAPAQP